MDIVTLAAARKGGGGGGDVTKAYVDEHLALKADKSETKEYPIASTTTGINPTITDSADGLIQDLTVYGESRVSKNLLDTGNPAISNFVEDADHYVSQVPSTSDSRAWNYANSQYFLTLPAGTYNIVFIAKTQTANTNSGLNIRDAENNLLVSLLIVNKSIAVGTFTLSATTDIGVMCKQFDAVARFMICTAADYAADPSFEPYGIISIGDSGSLNVQTRGKNFITDNNYYGTSTTINGITFTRNSDGSIYATGTATAEVTYFLMGEGWSYSASVKNILPKNKTYIMSGGNGVGQYIAMTTYLPSGSEAIPAAYTVDGHDTFSIPNIDNIGYLFYIRIGEGQNVGFTFRPQLELGSIATAYEPYISTTATLTTGLPYCGIPVETGETYTDEQGQKWLADTADVEGVTKRVYKITLDGTEAWGSSGITTDDSASFYTVVSPAAPNWTMEAIPIMISNNLDVVTGYQRYNGTSTNCISLTAGVNLGIRISGIKESADLKTYLASNPITVVYELAEPYEIPLTTAEKSALLNLKTFNSTTNVTITDSPTVDIGYLLNTANGQAVADAIDNAITGVLNTSY